MFNLLTLTMYLPAIKRLLTNWVMNFKVLDLVVDLEGYVRIAGDGATSGGSDRRVAAIRRIMDDLNLPDIPGDFDEAIVGRVIDGLISALNHYFGHNWAEKLRPYAERDADRKIESPVK